jgi:hypothetical protein
MQTHLAENRAEVKWVHELFPEARSYLDVYARAGLLHAKSVFAHGIWLDDADRAALHGAAAQIAHSPSSNLFLGSGLFDWRAAEAAGVAVSVASDVGGGTEPVDAAQLRLCVQGAGDGGAAPDAWKALHARRAAPRVRSASSARSARSTSAARPTSASGTGRSGRSRCGARSLHAICMSARLRSCCSGMSGTW